MLQKLLISSSYWTESPNGNHSKKRLFTTFDVSHIGTCTLYFLQYWKEVPNQEKINHAKVTGSTDDLQEISRMAEDPFEKEEKTVLFMRLHVDSVELYPMLEH